MFRTCCALLVLTLSVLSGCASKQMASNLEVRTTGDAQVYGVYSSSPFGQGHR